MKISPNVNNINIENDIIPEYEISRNLIGLHKPIKSLDILSKIGNPKIISDTSLNKYYKKYIQKQAYIQHEQKLYDLIEKLDDTKTFNSLKLEYLKEKALLQNIHNKKKENNKRVIYASNYVNLNNCEEKINAIYKLSAQDLNFMTSLMHFLGNRPKKVYKPKVNKKLEALSQGKIGLFLKKKQLSKQESKNNTIYNYNYHNNDTILKKNPYLKMFLNDQFDNNKKDKTITNNNMLSKTNEDFNKKYSSNINLRKKSISYEINNKTGYKRFMGKTKSTNFGITGYNYFINQTTPNDTVYSNFNNFVRNENLINNSESQNSNLEDNLTNNNTYNNYNNNLPYNRTKSKFNSQTSIFSLNNKSHSRSKNSTAKKISKDTSNNFNSKKNVLENVINQKYSTKISDDSDKNKILNKESDENDDFSITNLKKSDKRTIKNKLLKIYKKTMNEFLQKIKDEEKDLYDNSSKLSTLLYKFKKNDFEKFRNKNKNIKIKKNKTNNNFNSTLQKKRSSTTTLNLKQTDRNYFDNITCKTEKGNNIMANTFYPSWGKSKYNIPYINRIVYGEDHSLDPFEQLQKDLFFEVKNEIRKANITNRKKGKKGISLNGKEILNRFKNDNSSDIEENEDKKQ